MSQDVLVAPVITTSGTSFSQFKTGGLKVILDNLAGVAANGPKANPTTAATVAVTAATGGLLAGTYFCSYTFNDAFGETLAGGESASFTVTGTAQLATVTLPALPTGVQAINLYVTPAGGAAGSEYLFATGITATSFALTDTLPTDVPGATVPPTNSTGAPAHYKRLYAILTANNPETVMYGMREWESSYLRGDPMDRASIFRRHRLHYGIGAAWQQVYKEAATLAWANPGTLTKTQGVVYATLKNVL